MGNVLVDFIRQFILIIIFVKIDNLSDNHAYC